LDSAELAGTLVRLVGGEYTQLQRLTPALEELVRRGLAQVQQVPLLRVVPKR
jgi:3-hydroxyisobutyrate dehydrogenase-like beta-hydroxyacid dehydrogenase